MNLEHRLQHAARELRSVPIDVPPFAAIPARPRARSRLVPALAAPVLFAAGALFAVGAVRSVDAPVHSDIGSVLVVEPAADGPVDTGVADRAAPTESGPVDVAVPSIHDELRMISEFLADTAGVEPTAPRPGDDAIADAGIGPI